jgi:predicted short-subunit dehydrogenase-like oxidoreductase (DUF2520 family)
MDIVIIGTGNTATILGRKLVQARHRILQVYGRDSMAASELAYILDTESTNYWSMVNRTADLYIVAVSDIAIEEVIKELELPEKTMVHTAAAVSMDVLKKGSSHHGVFYPLQSLKKEDGHLPEIPIIIDASDEKTLEELSRLAGSISEHVIRAGDDQRLKIHLAAVFVNNFVNHLYVLAEDFCRKEGIDFSLLHPLIQETALRVKNFPPSKAQTGPATRGDAATMEKHRSLLVKHPELERFYELFSASIPLHKQV